MICHALRDLVPFAQFKVKSTHGGVLILKFSINFKINTLPWVFFTFFQLYEWYQIAQRITFMKDSGYYGIVKGVRRML